MRISRILFALPLLGSLQGCAEQTDFRSDPLPAVRAAACDGNAAAVWELDGRMKTGLLCTNEVTAIADEALDHRHAGDDPKSSLGWGSFLDRALSAGSLDQPRITRCYSEAVSVGWWGKTAVRPSSSDQNGILFVFRPAVGPDSLITFDATIESAMIGDESLPVEFREEHFGYAHVPNPAPGVTYVGLAFSPEVAGKTLVVQWRVMTLDARTGQALVRDWVHSESIDLPAAGDGTFFGRCVPAQREPLR